MSQLWKRLHSEIIHQNPFLAYKHDVFETGQGVKGDYYYISKNGSALVIPILADGQVVMVKNYRYLFDRWSLEFPGGVAKDGQSHEQAARDELREETGLVAEELINIGEFAPINGLADEICRVFLARQLTQKKSQPDATEELEVVIRRLDEIEDLVRRNEIWDGVTLAAWAIVRPHLLREG